MRSCSYICVFLLLLLVLFSCSLSADQELHLGRDIGAYIEARNSGDAIQQIGLTHPSVVKVYVHKGEDALKERFQEITPRLKVSDPITAQDATFFWKNYYVMRTSKTGNQIEVSITVQAENKQGDKKQIDVIASSLNNGENWVFYFEDEKGLVR
jgi:hypothetical protein